MPGIEDRADLALRCERALLASARAQRIASRQQLRAAARRFVRRHARDTGYLAWVLCSVAASSALAVALLGLGAQPASAAATHFTEVTGAANPFPGVDGQSRPALTDLDGDGDLDLVAADFFGIHYYENTGDATSSAFVPHTGAANPFDGLSVDALRYPAPAFGDLDRDGDLDAVVADYYGDFAYRYLENTGTAIAPAFAERTDAQNPFLGLPYMATPTLGDLDGDGDLDLVSGSFTDLRYLENTGDAESPAFVERTGSANPVDGVIGYGFFTTPAFGDLDRDGDLDLIVGTYDGTIRYLENTGSAATPAFVSRPHAVPNEFVGYSSPALGDLDGDGDLDLVASWVFSSGDDLHYFENRAGRRLVWISGAGPANPFADLSVAELASSPALGDLDGDGDLDLVSGTYFYGLFRYFENIGSATSPAFAQRTGAADPFDGLSIGRYSAPALGDLDGDGDLDLVAGAYDGSFFYFENTGSAASPAFAARTGNANPLDGEDVGFRSAPTLGDIDGDGDLDLFSGEEDYTLAYFENTGSAASAAFVKRTGAQDPLDGQVFQLQPAPSLGDLDGDGDLDLVADAYTFSVYFENRGSPASPAFLPRSDSQDLLPLEIAFLLRAVTPGDLDGDGDLDLVGGESGGFFLLLENALMEPSPSSFELPGGANPLAGEDVGSHATSALGDLDADGDFDLVAGAISNPLRFFENTGSAVAPAYLRRTGAENPFESDSAGLFSAPALADLDADGDLDVVAGSSSETGAGALLFFESTGSATAPAFVTRTGAANPVGALDVGDLPRPTLGDLDADGDLDLVVGAFDGSLLTFANTGDVETPAFAAQTGAANPLDGVDVGDVAAPALGDIDEDGDLDLVVGNTTGAFAYFENTGSATDAAFTLRTGAANPFAAHDVGDNAAPALGDLDADGDLDLVAGSYSGEFRTVYLPEPGYGLLIGAGVALLGWLARLRRRRAR